MARQSEQVLALLEAARRAEAEAEILQDGPINTTFRFTWNEGNYVARKRLPNLSRTNQLFAAERFVEPVLRGRLRMPELLAVRLRREKMAIFRHIDNIPPDWTDHSIQEQLVRALIAVHSIPGHGLGGVNMPRRVVGQARYLWRMFDREFFLFCRTAPLSAGEASALRREKAAFELFEERQPTLCHGDVHSLNFLQDRSGQLWTIDWEAARYRFPEADFNQMHTGWLSEEIERRVLTAYCATAGLELGAFTRGVRAFRILWHLRTYNFFVEGRKDDAARHLSHVERLRRFMEETE
jgi:aminoglycoside phosphotransferase (APT) family kinase protein